MNIETEVGKQYPVIEWNGQEMIVKVLQIDRGTVTYEYLAGQVFKNMLYMEHRGLTYTLDLESFNGILKKVEDCCQ